MKSFSLASAALLAALAPLTAQGSILPYLPKDTIMAMAAPDLTASAAELAKMPLAKMWAEEEVQAFFADVLDLAHKKLDEGMKQAKAMHAQGQLPFDPEQLLKLRVHGGAFAVTKLGMIESQRGPMPSFGMLLHLDFGDSAASWNQLLELGLGMLEGRAGKQLTKQETMVGEVKLRSYTPPPQLGLDMGLHVAMLPRGVLIGTFGDEVRETVAAFSAKTAMLGAASHYQTTTARLDRTGAEFEMFVRMDPFVRFGLESLRMLAEQQDLPVDMEGVARAVEAMGWTNLGSSAMTSSYVDGKCITRAVTTSGAPTATAAVKTVDTSFLKWVPNDAVSFSAGTLDVMSFYDMVVRGLNAYDEKLAKQLLEQLAGMEQQLGFKIRDDFFGAFGDHYITWSMPLGTLSSPPETAVLVKVTDETKLVKVLKNLVKLTRGMLEIEEGEKRGVMVYQVRVNFDPTQGMGMNPFDVIQPTFSFKNGYCVIGFTASDVKRVFQRMDRKEDDPKGDIRGNKEFAAVAASIPAGVTSLSFTDWKSSFESGYQVVTSLLSFVPIGDTVPIDMTLIPDSGTLTKHLFASVAYTKTDANGTESVVVSPFGPEIGLVVGAAMVAGAAAFVAVRGPF